MKDYYKILNIDKDSTYYDIRKSYMYNKVKYRSNPTELEEIEEAYQTLSDMRKRNKYDESLTQENINDNLNVNEFVLEDGTKVTPKDIADAFNRLVKTTKTKPLSEEREIYLEAYYRSHLKDATKGTDKTPRKQMSTESDAEYKIYLTEYYNILKENNIKYIQNSDIPLPRYRKPYETDEHYNKYLEVYYGMVLTNKKEIFLLEDKSKTTSQLSIENKKEVPLLLEDKSKDVLLLEQKPDIEKEQPPLTPPKKEESHQVIKRKPSKLKRLVKTVLFAGALLFSVMGTKLNLNKGEHIPSDLLDQNKITQDINNNENNNSNKKAQEDKIIDQDINNQIDQMLNHNEENKNSTVTVGDIINLNSGVNYYYNSLGDTPMGTVGNSYTQPGNYIVDALSIVDTNNELVAVTYDGGISLEKLAEQYGIDLSSGKYKINYHFSDNESLELLNGTANQKGWVTYEKENYNKQGNILDKGTIK